jgi:predicted DNA repair protein MutK
VPIFVKVDDTTVHVDEHANDGARNELVGAGLLADSLVLLNSALRVKIATPFLFVENITSIEVKAPNIFLTG